MGVPPVLPENILLHRLLTLKIFTMENVLPKCKCGADVHFVVYQVPHYDDGGGLETVEEEYGFWNTCIKCFANSASSIEDESDLPF
jgi:hypothetical protein